MIAVYNRFINDSTDLGNPSQWNKQDSAKYLGLKSNNIKSNGAADTANYWNKYKAVIPNDGPYDSLYRHIILGNNKGTDWQKAVLQRGDIQSYSLSINGGDDKYKYDLSGSYYSEDGIIMNTWLKKFMFRFDNQIKFTKHINGEATFSYARSKMTDYFGGYSIYNGVLPLAVQLEPIVPIYNPVTGDYTSTQINNTSNPVAADSRLADNIKRIDYFVSNLSLNAEIFEGLTFTTKLGNSFNFQNPSQYTPKYNYGNAVDFNAVSWLNDKMQRDFVSDWTNYFTYQKEIGKHSINLMVGEEDNYFLTNQINVRVFGVPADKNLQYLEMANADNSNVAPWVTRLHLIILFPTLMMKPPSLHFSGALIIHLPINIWLRQV